ncbi:MAG TPA: hypothetical protein VH934_08065 [Xanthobacteraceae bacterium]|jgi:hypothetical protein
MMALACAVLVVGAAATAAARPKKHRAEHRVERTTTTQPTMCYGTPIIMQGVACPARSARTEEPPPTEQPKRPRVSRRGSSGPYVPALQPTPSLTLQQPSAAPYIPPPVANPSAQINQLNQSFPLNRGLGNNPSDRDSYIRYNFNR